MEVQGGEAQRGKGSEEQVKSEQKKDTENGIGVTEGLLSLTLSFFD